MSPQSDLHNAICASSLERVEEALKAGANPSAGTIMELAVVNTNHIEHSATVSIVRALLRAGASTEVCFKAKDRVLSVLERDRIFYSKDQCGSLNAILVLLETAVEPNQVATIPNNTANVWKKLLFSSKYSDVQFVFPDGTSLHAHRCVLAAASPYFDTYFEGPWKQDNNGVWKTQNPPPVMKAFLSFIYTGDLVTMEAILDEDETNLCVALSLAVQYQLPSIKQMVETRLKKALSLTTVKDTLFAAHLHSSKDLKTACFDYIRQNTAQAMFEPSILELAQEDPELWSELSVAVSGNERKRKN